MQLLIVSDTHKDKTRLENLIKKHHPDLVLHAGDYDIDENEIAKLTDHYVYGNWDINAHTTKSNLEPCATNFVKLLPKSYKIIEIEHKKFLLTHFWIAYDNMVWVDKNANVHECIDKMLADIKTKYHLDYIIFGHTHKPSINGNIINPGSLTSPKQIPAVPTYILGESKGDGKFKFKIMEF